MKTLVTGTALALVALAFSAAPGQAAGAQPADASVQASPAGLTSPISGRLEAYVKSHGTRYTFGTYVDSGNVILETDAPLGVVASVIGGERVLLRRTGIKDAFGGGSGITAEGQRGRIDRQAHPRPRHRDQRHHGLRREVQPRGRPVRRDDLLVATRRAS